MELILKFINNIQLYLFVFSGLYILRTFFFFLLSFRKEEKLVFTTKSLLYLGGTLSFFIGSLFNGLKY